MLTILYFVKNGHLFLFEHDSHPSFLAFQSFKNVLMNDFGIFICKKSFIEEKLMLIQDLKGMVGYEHEGGVVLYIEMIAEYVFLDAICHP